METLLLIAHGSRREASNREVRDLAERLAQVSGERFGLVVPAFLELAEPDISGGVGRCVEAGATSIVAVPYFLSAGRHVATDIPRELDKARCSYPDVAILQSNYLGKHETIPGILLTMALNKSDTAAQTRSSEQISVPA